METQKKLTIKAYDEKNINLKISFDSQSRSVQSYKIPRCIFMTLNFDIASFLESMDPFHATRQPYNINASFLYNLVEVEILAHPNPFQHCKLLEGSYTKSHYFPSVYVSILLHLHPLLILPLWHQHHSRNLIPKSRSISQIKVVESMRYKILFMLVNLIFL